MNNNLGNQDQLSNPEALAGQFSRLGWIGFWIQLVLVSVPIVLMLYVIFIASPASVQRKGIDLSNYLSYGSLIVMVFTTYWFFQYTRLAEKIADPGTRPSLSGVTKNIWIGMWASCVGIFFSMVLLLQAVLRLLFILLATPQTGIPIAQTGADPSQVLSAIDAVTMTSLSIILTAELIIMAFSVWLLFRATRPAKAVLDAASAG